MGRVKRLLSNTAIFGVGTFASKLLVFLLMPLYTSYLSSAEFGVADIITQTANLIIPLAVLGVGDGILRFTIRTRPEEKKRVFSASIMILLVGMIPLAALIQLLRLISVYDGYLWLVFAYICCANLHLIVANYVRGAERTKVFAVQGILNTALVIGLNILFLVAFDMGVMGYVLSVVISDFIISVCLILYCKLYKDFKPKLVGKDVVKSLLKFSIPYIPLTLMWTITAASDRFVILATLGDNATSINGLYAAAYKIPTLITMVGSIFIKAWQISSVSEEDPEERASFFEKVYKNYVGLIFIGGAGLIAFTKIFTRILLNESYYDSWEFVPVLIIAMIFSTLSEFFGTVYFVEKRNSRSLLTATLGAVVNIILNFALIPYFGAMGAAIATAICYALVFIARFWDTRRYISFKKAPIKTFINTAVVVAQTVIILLNIPYWWIWQIALVAFMIVFNGKDLLKLALSVIRRKEKNKNA